MIKQERKIHDSDNYAIIDILKILIIVLVGFFIFLVLNGGGR